MKTNDLETFSWEIVKGEYCLKKMDKSFFRYGETVIPIGIRSYFDITNNTNGDKLNINIQYKHRVYDAVISFENNFNRSKLRVSRSLHNQIIDSLKAIPHVEQNFSKVLLVFITQGLGEFILKVNYQV